ncbi:MAG TPA: FAD-linked oxidase C-terminal domain-containing protein [Solirubrobacteraceae bacterium]|jgi:FAD/FMN-containing dehydrogenase|nr:FAD-linked oxidase C-terminal domain-containing protein [Solirubrobacteraceae bacterium]
MRDSPIHRELRGLLGAEHVLDADDPQTSPYNGDSARRRGVVGRADAVALPGSAHEVAEVVRWCYAHELPIVARGGGSGLLGGAVPSEGGVLLSLERLRAVRELEPALWRMLPEAGVRTGDVQRLARENGLFFGPDPGASEQSQIGGNVATNAGGPHALKYGVTGAWVTGLEVVLAPGELVQIGGWARKDVAGYDLKDLLIGSEGTLGVITAVNLRLRPAPAATLTVVVLLGSAGAQGGAQAGCEAMLDVLGAGIEPAALEFIDRATLALVAGGYPGEPAPSGSGFALLVELDGSRADVAREREALREVLGGRAAAIEEVSDARALWRWRDGFNGVVTGARGGKVSQDVAFPPERLAEGLLGFAEIAERHGLRSCAWGHGGDGNVHATVLVDPSEEAELDAADAVEAELFELVRELGGSIAAEHGVGLLKSGLLEGQWDARAVQIHEAIKRSFDPKGLLNPGKKLGGLRG